MTTDTGRQDRATRRAVRRAAWTGHAPDARIDALARDAADNTVRNVWQPVFYAVILTIELVLGTYRLIAGPPPPTDTVLSWVAIAVLNAASLGLLVYLQWRSRRYLARITADTIGRRS